MSRAGTRKTQRTIQKSETVEYPLDDVVDAFLLDRRAQRLAAGTLRFYRQKLDLLARFCAERAIDDVAALSADDLRRYLLWLEQRGHNPGGMHAAYRALRALLRWFELEFEPDGWRNPIDKVSAPRQTKELLDPAEWGIVGALLDTCRSGFYGRRDRAALLLLVDTGLRAGELLALDVNDYNATTGRLHVRRGKGGKGRVVFAGRKTRKALRRYLAVRPKGGPALWVTSQGDRLSYDGLRSVVTRRAETAGVAPPSLHSFRRLFAVTCVRNGMDLRTLQELLGHSSLAMLTRYVKLAGADLRAAHGRAGPVDNGRW